jgi:hypothetical protein
MTVREKNPYIGFRTYLESDSTKFVGRADDIDNIYSRIVKNDITILYANSGIGKSSVINAGLCPKLKSNRYFPIYIRCGKHFSTTSLDDALIKALSSPQNLASIFGNSENPVIIGKKVIPLKKIESSNYSLHFKIVSAINENSDAFLQELDLKYSKKSLWWFLHTREIYGEMGGFEFLYTPVLILDQFEEFFDHSDSFEQSGEVFSWLNDLFSSSLPDEIQTQFNNLISEGNEERPVFDASFTCKALISMRREYVGQLDYWAYQNENTRNSSLLYNRYLLRPLKKQQAEQVISLSSFLNKDKNKILRYVGGKEQDGYPAILLSVICNEILERDNGELLLKASNVESILKLAYTRVLTKTSLSQKEIEEIERRLVDRESCKRIRRRRSDLLKFIPGRKITQLLKYHILTSVGENFYELIHDRIAEVVSERIKHTKKRRENALLRKSELNILTEEGRELIDNAIDFGGVRTLTQRPSNYPLDTWVALGPNLKINQKRNLRSQRKVDNFYLKGVFDEDRMDETFSYLYFNDKDGNKVCTNDGIYQYRIKYKGEKIEEVRFFGKTTDEYIYVSGGYHGVKIEIENVQTDGSYIEKRTYINHKGEPIENVDNYSVIRLHYNAYGLIDKVRFYNIEDKQCLHANGNHGFDSYFDEDGYEITRLFVDLDGTTPKSIISGVYGRSLVFEHSEGEKEGLLVKETNIDNNGKKMVDVDGYCSVEYDYDSRRRVISESYYDMDEKLSIGHRGYAKAITKYGDDDSIESYYNVEDEMIQAKEGYYITYNSYDKHGRIISCRNKDKQYNLVLDNGGSSGFSLTYDERGRISSFKKYGQGNRQSFAMWMEYNLYGTHVVKAGNLNAEGERINGGDYDCYAMGIVECGLQYPVMVFLDKDGRQQKCNDGYWAVMKESNSEGDTVRETYYDKNYNPMLHKDGYYGLEYDYDYMNNTQKVTYIWGSDCDENIVHSMLTYMDKYGESIKQLYYNKNNKIIRDTDGICGCIVRYSEDMTKKEVILINEKEQETDNNDGVSRHVVERVYLLDEWKPVKQYNLNKKGELVPDSWGDYMTLCEYDDNAQGERIISADEFGKPRMNVRGYAIRNNKYDKSGNLLEESYYDEKGVLCLVEEQGYAIRHNKYDKRGNLTEISYYDEKGNLCFVKEKCMAGVDCIYDDQDRVVSVKYYDETKTPILNNEYGAYIIKFEHDSKMKRTIFLDKEGNPMECPFGYEVVERLFNKTGELIEERYYDHNHIPAPDSDGDYGCSLEYEKINGETIKRVCSLGEDGKPHINKQGYAYKETRTDEKERIVYEKYFDETMHPICMWEGETFMVQKEYLDEKNEIIISYYKPNGTIGKGENGISIQHIFRDNKGRIIKELYYDSENAPLCIDKGVCGYMVEYDDENNSELVITINKKGNPSSTSKGFCKCKTFKDGEGRTIKEIRYDDKDNIFVDEDGDAGKAYIYDKDNPNAKTTVSLDSEGNPHINKKGWAYETIIQDNEGRPIFRFQYDANRNPISDKDGDFGVRIQYTEQDGTYIQTLLDASGNPHMSTLGYSSRLIVKNGLERKELNYDVNGNPVFDSLGDAGTGYLYDDDNPNSVVFVSLDESGNPRMNKEGWTYKRQLVNENNQVLQFSLYDINHQPVADETGNYGEKYDYLEDGKSFYVTYLNESEEPHENLKGIARRLIVKDDYGRTIKQMDYDLYGNAVFDELGDAGTIYEYEDYSSTPTKYVSIDEKGKPRINIYGYAIRQVKYGDNGRIKEEYFFDTEGNPTTDNHGCHGLKYLYKEDSSERIVICLDEKGHPFITKDGFAAISKVRDESGRVIQEIWYNEDLEPVADEIGDYGVAIEYCEDGGRITTSLNYDMMPRVNNLGYAKRYSRYDDKGRLVQERWFDMEGEPTTNEHGDCGIGRIYGDKENDITYVSLDAEGRPRLNDQGWAFNRRVTDDKERVIADFSYDSEQAPIENELGDCGTITEYYDDENKTIEISLDEDGQPHFNKYGYVKKVIYRDEKGRKVKERTLDVYGNPTPDPWGDCGTNYIYDDERNAVTMLSLDENETPRINAKGWAYETKVYDEKNRVILRQQFDTEHNLIPDADGDCGEITVFDDEKNSRSVSRLGVDGEVRVNSWGLATIRSFEDSIGHPIKYEFLNENGEPVKDENGNYGIAFSYEDNPQERTMICLDEKGNPHECIHGFAYRKEFLNERGDIIKSFRYDIKMEPAIDYECRATYCGDENHTEIRTYYDVDGNEHNNVRGYHKEISFNDKNGRRKEIYFDIDGNVVRPKE